MTTELQKMLAGEPYDPNDSGLVAGRTRARALCGEINGMPVEDPRRRDLLARLFGAGGDSAYVTPPFFCDYGGNIDLGANVYFNFNCVLLDVCRITVGEHTLFGPAVQVYTALHPLDARLRRRQEYGKPVTIGSDVWIGGAAVILPGVSIGDRAVIGAGSVVTRDVPPDVFAAGNPCRVIRAIP